jgi:hypothetical protein
MATRLARSARAEEALAMVVAPPPPDEGGTTAVKKATAHKRAGEPTPREKALAERPAKKATRGRSTP